jgi:hypothetical protein
MFHGNWKLRKLVQKIIHYRSHFYLLCRKRRFLLPVMINNVEAYAQNKNRKVVNFCSQFSQWPFHAPNSKTYQDDTSVVATAAILNAPVLSTVFKISRWPIHCYSYDGNLPAYLNFDNFIQIMPVVCKT